MSFFVGRNQKGRVGTLLCCVKTVVVIVVTVVIIDTVVVTECCDTWDEVDSIAISLFGWSKQIQYKAAPNSIRRQDQKNYSDSEMRFLVLHEVAADQKCCMVLREAPMSDSELNNIKSKRYK